MYRCVSCDRTYPETAGTPWRCSCHGPLEFAGRPLPERDEPPAQLDRDDGLWAFDAFLPVDRTVTLGEGWTPLVETPTRNVRYKLEWLFPTGSFKDRGAAVTLSHAKSLAVDRVVEDSSGNAGAAIATYAARADIDAEIFVPADAKPGKLRAIERTGATVRRIDGSRADVTDACIDAIGESVGDSADAGADSLGWYASHAWNPAFFEGTATFAYELAAQCGWEVPDAVVTPLGHGTLFLGAYRGFKALREAGWIDEIPRLYGAQATGVAPIVEDRRATTDDALTNDIADGIQIETPARREQIHEALEKSGGDAVAIDAATTEIWYDRLHNQGFYVEPTCAVAPSALEQLRASGEIRSDEDVVVALTGSGLKT